MDGNTAGDKVSLAGKPGTDSGFEWWANKESDFFRKAYDSEGRLTFTPFYEMMDPISPFRRLLQPEGTNRLSVIFGHFLLSNC